MQLEVIDFSEKHANIGTLFLSYCIEDYMPLSIVIHHYLISTDLNKQSGVVNYTNLGGISCLPGIIIHYNLFKIFLMQLLTNCFSNRN